MQQHVLPILLRWRYFREQLGQQFFANNAIRLRRRVRKKSIIVREHLRREVTHSRDFSAPGKEIGRRASVAHILIWSQRQLYLSGSLAACWREERVPAWHGRVIYLPAARRTELFCGIVRRRKRGTYYALDVRYV
jgi:hypothetical protein